MSYENYTETAREVLRRAAVLAGERGHTYLGSEHLLLALTSSTSKKRVLKSLSPKDTCTP